MPKKRRHAGKTRTRGHIIADLAVNHLERRVLLRGFTLDKAWHDYGVDLAMTTYNEEGEVESGQVLFQVKATDRLKILKDGTISWTLERADLKRWLFEPVPVILIVYDGSSDKAWWLYIQQYFEARSFNLFSAPKHVNVRIPSSQRVSLRAIDKFGRFSNALQAQITASVQHER